MKKTIYVGMNIPDEVAVKYQDEFNLIYPPAGKRFSPEESLGYLIEAHGYLGGQLNKDMIDKVKNLEIACSFGAGFDGIDHRYAGEKGIWVMNAPHATTKPTAELTITLLLCLSRRIFNLSNHMRKLGTCAGPGPFAGSIDSAPGPTPVHGKTLGIIGFGKIGKEVAKRARGLDMDVIYFDIFRASEEVEKELGAKFVSFEEVLKTADFVTIHSLYDPQTNHHMIGAEQFAMMKPTAYFINCARGKLMDEQALIDAIKSKKILGAALDVYEFEPKVTPELFELEEVVMTPHIGTVTREDRLGMANEALSGIAAQLRGDGSPTIVNREYYKAK